MNAPSYLGISLQSVLINSLGDVHDSSPRSSQVSSNTASLYNLHLIRLHLQRHRRALDIPRRVKLSRPIPRVRVLPRHVRTLHLQRRHRQRSELDSAKPQHPSTLSPAQKVQLTRHKPKSDSNAPCRAKRTGTTSPGSQQGLPPTHRDTTGHHRRSPESCRCWRRRLGLSRARRR